MVRPLRFPVTATQRATPATQPSRRRLLGVFTAASVLLASGAGVPLTATAASFSSTTASPTSSGSSSSSAGLFGNSRSGA